MNEINLTELRVALENPQWRSHTDVVSADLLALIDTAEAAIAYLEAPSEEEDAREHGIAWNRLVEILNRYTI